MNVGDVESPHCIPRARLLEKCRQMVPESFDLVERFGRQVER